MLVVWLVVLAVIGGFLYTDFWKPMIGLGLISYLFAMMVVIAIAYVLGWLPAADELFRALRGQVKKNGT